MSEERRTVQALLNEFGISPTDALHELANLEKKFEDFPFEAKQVDPREFLDFVAEHAERSDGEEYNLVKSSSYFLDYFWIWYRELLGYMSKIEQNASRDDFILRTYVVYKAAIRHASYASADEPVVARFVLNQQAKRARAKRAMKSDSLALEEAIRAELSDGCVDRPYKQAVAILDGVNRRLSESGIATVSVDKVYRRLVARAALLKSAENDSD